jgi:early secretory antigenic target protein ESAT-6
MTRYQVDSDAVLNATGAVRTTIDRLQSECASLYAQLVQLESSWTGSAASAFSAAVTEWKGVQQLVEQNLASLNQGLGLAGQQYAEIETANTRLFVR